MAPDITDSLRELLESFGQSDVYQKLAAATILGREVPFVMTREDGQPVQGIIDLIYRCDDRIWIADYKTDRVAAKDVRKRAERYRPQMTYYKTAAQQMQDVISGRVPIIISAPPQMEPYIKVGKLRAIAVSAPKRLTALPDIPAMNEALPGFEFVGWYGVVGPARMPQPVVAKIHAETAAYVKTPEFMKRAIADGAEAVGSDPESFRQMMLADMKKLAELVKRSGAKFN